MFDIRWRGSPRGKTQTFPTSLGTESHSVSVSLIAYTYIGWQRPWKESPWNDGCRERTAERSNGLVDYRSQGNRKRSVVSCAASILVKCSAAEYSSLHARLPYFVCTILSVRVSTIRAHMIISVGG